MSNSTLVGVLILARHGDRAGFYQDPTTYTPTGTVITPLGTQQELQLGSILRSRYLNASSPLFVRGINSSLVNANQIHVRADAGGESGVIYDSAVAMLQGLFPANANYTTSLSNGSVIEGAESGYQYVPIETVETNNDVSLEGWTSCGAFDQWTSGFYASPAFQAQANESASFLSQLPPYLDGRAVTLENMWNIYDFMNVQSIHNKAFAQALPPTFLAQARTLANWHEYGVFTSPQLNGIGNIAGRTILPQMLQELHSIANASDPLKIAYQAIAYKPFLSLFNMTGVAEQNPELAGIVNYAAAVALEVRQPSDGSEAVLRFNFKNGTGQDFVTYNFLGSTTDVPISTLVQHVNPAMINTTIQWCNACGNNANRGCGELALAASQASAVAVAGFHSHHDRISPVGAGFLGAGLTLAVFAIMFGVLAFLGLLTFGRKRSQRSNTQSEKKV